MEFVSGIELVVAVRGGTIDDDLVVLFSSAHRSRQISQSCTTLHLRALALVVRVLGLPLPLVRICENFTRHCLAPWYLILRFTEIFPHPESLAAQAAYTEPFLPGLSRHGGFSPGLLSTPPPQNNEQSSPKNTELPSPTSRPLCPGLTRQSSVRHTSVPPPCRSLPSRNRHKRAVLGSHSLPHTKQMSHHRRSEIMLVTVRRNKSGDKRARTLN